MRVEAPVLQLLLDDRSRKGADLGNMVSEADRGLAEVGVGQRVPERMAEEASQWAVRLDGVQHLVAVAGGEDTALLMPSGNPAEPPMTVPLRRKP